MNWRLLWHAVVDGAAQTAVVMLLVAASALLGGYLTEQQLPQQLAAMITGITSEPWAILMLMNVFFLVIGLFLHSAAAIILVVPIVMPVVTAAGIDPRSVTGRRSQSFVDLLEDQQSGAPAANN